MRLVFRAIFAVSAFSLCMLLSFSLVRQWTHSLPSTTGVSTAAAEAAPALRNAANALASLGNDLHVRLPQDKPANAEAAAWVARVVPERAKEAVANMAGLGASLEEAEMLQAAAERLTRLAGDVNNQGQRKQAWNELRLAIDAAEEYIARHRAEGYCREKRQPARF